jgi:AcrR family transcriptional regulator
MEEIARAADVGVGTLYRHFPDRGALLEEIVADALDRLVEFGRAPVPGAAGDTPHWDAFVRLVAYSAGEPFALLKSFTEEAPAVPADKLRAAEAMLQEAAGRAQEEGTLRADLTPAEAVAVLSAAVCRPGARFGDPLTRVMLDGLRV